MATPSRRSAPLGATLLFTLLSVAHAPAQDNVLVYGNSIVFAPTVGYFRDLVTQTGAPQPNVVTFIQSDKKTSNYVNQIGLITSSLPAGQTWRAVVVEGGTVENVPGFGDPTAFQNNMLTLANAFFAHSPNGLFLGHETGADHPNSSNYPTVAPDPATWLAWSHDGYATAAAAITAAHPTNPPARIAEQGTCYAATAGYPALLYSSDFHHPSTSGKVLIAMLWYVAIYGGRIEDIAVDFGSSTPLVNRLLGDGIGEAEWLELVGFADRSQPAAARPYPGSDGDFQLRACVDSTIVNLVTHQTATSGSTLRIQPFSPLGATQNEPAAVYADLAITGQMPSGGTPPELWLDAGQMRLLLQVTDLSGSPVDVAIPSGLTGYTMWIQAISRGPVGGSTTYSDAQLVTIQ
ncbi:MAG: hypothetical protein KDE27_15200 [Planctomycetes bacterium]|nr:hypothetical protein [Planctomycetota bacterium]